MLCVHRTDKKQCKDRVNMKCKLVSQKLNTSIDGDGMNILIL